MHNHNNIQYLDNGVLKMIRSSILHLRREQNSEVLYTRDGLRIPLENLISLDGFNWA